MFWTWLSVLITRSGTSMQIGAVEIVLKPGCHRSWQDVISMADISLSKPLMCEIWIITSSELTVWITQLFGHALPEPWPYAQLAFPVLTLKWPNRLISKLQFSKERSLGMMTQDRDHCTWRQCLLSGIYMWWLLFKRQGSVIWGRSCVLVSYGNYHSREILQFSK